jgi:hypothetical protein
MHTKELAHALRTFAAIADFDRSQELHRLAALLDRGQNETIAARLKRMSPADSYPLSLKETLESIAAGLRVSGAAKSSAAFSDLLRLFKGRPGASIDEFCASVCAPAEQSVIIRRFKAANSRLANDICSALAGKTGNLAAFFKQLDDLAVTSPAGTATWTLVANRVIGNRRIYRDRKSAIRAIKKHAEDLKDGVLTGRATLVDCSSSGGCPS